MSERKVTDSLVQQTIAAKIACQLYTAQSVCWFFNSKRTCIVAQGSANAARQQKREGESLVRTLLHIFDDHEWCSTNSTRGRRAEEQKANAEVGGQNDNSAFCCKCRHIAPRCSVTCRDYQVLLPVKRVCQYLLLIQDSNLLAIAASRSFRHT